MSAGRWGRRAAAAGIFLAASLALQIAAGGGGYLPRGICADFALAAAVYGGGYWCALALACLSPLGAFLLGLGPDYFRFVPFLAIGNAAFVSLLYVMGRRELFLERAGALGMAGVARLILLWITLLRVLIPAMDLPEQEMGRVAFPFTWPQIFTALVGGGIAAALYPPLRRMRARFLPPRETDPDEE